MKCKLYPPVLAGHWVEPSKFYWLCCCDCGLIHKFEFRVVKGKAQLRAWRDNRATGQFRRHHKIKVKRAYKSKNA